MHSSPVAFAEVHSRRFVTELQDFVRIPSISAQPERAPDVGQCADWLAAHLRHIGLAPVMVIRTAGHPIVYAAWLGAPGRPTVLIYGHYDVQPPGPAAAWRTPPFEPTIRGSDLVGRGSSDDKGPLFAHVKAIESWLATSGRLPVNLVCLFEGEEEIGSPHLSAMLSARSRGPVADLAVVSDTRMLGPHRPAITYALRGSLNLEIEVRCLAEAVHSGAFGGAVPNAPEVLARMLARLHDARGRVAIPGFYEQVAPIGNPERAYLAESGPSDAEILTTASARRAAGEAGYTSYERTTIRPALTVSGLASGYAGRGAMTIVPGRAIAKLNVRLVPHQDPRHVDKLIRRFVATAVDPTATTIVHTLASAPPILVDIHHPAVRAATSAYTRTFHSYPVFLRSGGTIPIVATLQERLGLPVVLMGFALPDDGMHGPNEKVHIPTFRRSVATSIRFLAEVAHMVPCGPMSDLAGAVR
jgi:acetylornithine deacetylase/succinyl-diaminopimelate desuccinylase-like protein